MIEKGIKYDSEKPRLSNMIKGFYAPLCEVAKVYNFGAEKYGLENWKLVEEHRYKDALVRHTAAICSGEDINKEQDKEENTHIFYHAAQVAWNGLALCYFALQRNQLNTCRDGVVNGK